VTTRRNLALLAATAVAAGGVATAIAIAGHADDPGVGVGFTLGSLFVGVALGLVGGLLLAVRPTNLLGPVLFVMGASLVAELSLREYAYTGLRADPGSVPVPALAGGVGLALDPLFFPVPLALALALFPDGRLGSRRWRAVTGVATAVVAVQIVLLLLRPGPLTDETYGYQIPWAGVLPRSALGWVTRAHDGLTRVSLLMLVATGASLVVRYVRARGEQRRRLTPLALVALVAVVGLLAQLWPFTEALGRLVLVAAITVGLPAALAIGALRYHVWDLDRILVASLVYSGLALAIGSGYVAVVVGVTRLTGDRDNPPGLVPSVVAAAFVAVAFGQVKDALTRAARRLVHGVRATPYDALAALPRQLADVPVVEEVLPRTAEALVRGLGVPAARVRVFLDDGAERTAWSPDGSADGAPAVESVAVRHLGQVVGDVAVATSSDRPLRRGDYRLLTDLAAQAGPALRSVALTKQLEARLELITEQSAQLRASRQRIAAAQVEERRRLERDMHDGAQQQLVALAGRIRRAERLAAAGPDDLAEALAACVAAVDRCIDDVRQLASGIYPPVLAARGLAAALRARARSVEHVRVEFDPELAGARFPIAVELGAYFCCLEAMQNSAKHSPGAPVEVRLRTVESDLVFVVTDHGPGFDLATTPDSGGSGLLGMQDRIAAVGGTLTVESAPGHGTTVRGRIPVPA
jgi:signal transduction histidine kinase